jgi:hypothetical protein
MSTDQVVPVVVPDDTFDNTAVINDYDPENDTVQEIYPATPDDLPEGINPEEDERAVSENDIQERKCGAILMAWVKEVSILMLWRGTLGEIEDLDRSVQMRERTRHVKEDPLKQERLVDAASDYAQQQGKFESSFPSVCHTSVSLYI